MSKLSLKLRHTDISNPEDPVTVYEALDLEVWTHKYEKVCVGDYVHLQVKYPAISCYSGGICDYFRPEK